LFLWKMTGSFDSLSFYIPLQPHKSIAPPFPRHRPPHKGEDGFH
jgi:hypothetical protein